MRHVEVETRHNRPGEVHLRIVAEIARRRPGEPGIAVSDLALIGHSRDRVAREADAAADERRNAVPSAEIDVAIDQAYDRRRVGAIKVEELRVVAEAAVVGEAWIIQRVERLKVTAAPVFQGHVAAQPRVDLIANADVEHRLRREAGIVERLVGAGAVAAEQQRIRHILQIGCRRARADADIAAQIPAVQFRGGDRRGLHRRGGGRRSAADATRVSASTATPAKVRAFRLAMNSSPSYCAWVHSTQRDETTKGNLIQRP